MNIFQSDHTQKPPIFLLIKNHQNEEAKEHLRRNPAEIFLKGWMDDTPLHVASSSGNFEMLQYLIQKGAQVNAARTGMYATPLCWADNREIAEYLLDNGATMEDKELYLATRQNKVKVVDLLLSRGAKIDKDEPQYLVCNSRECIAIYLKHNIKIAGCDKQGSNLLHSLAWNNLPLVFDFAYTHGCPWTKDHAGRTPYHLAKQGARKNILDHFKEHYAALIAHKVEPITIENYTFEGISTLKQVPNSREYFVALTQSKKLVKYRLVEGEVRIEKIASVKVLSAMNFTFDKKGNILLPTGDRELLLVEQTSFEFLGSITLAEGLDLNQIEYLPSKNIFLGSSSHWEIILLGENFSFISKTNTEDGTFCPKINQQENLVAFFSYDQETYYDLYDLKADLSISFVESFFKDWGNTSSDLAFQNNEFAVIFPKVLEYYLYANNLLEKKWELDISDYTSRYDLGYLATPNEGQIILGKGKKILDIDTSTQRIKQVIEVDLQGEIRGLYLDKEKKYLLVLTENELKAIELEFLF